MLFASGPLQVAPFVHPIPPVSQCQYFFTLHVLIHAVQKFVLFLLGVQGVHNNVKGRLSPTNHPESGSFKSLLQPLLLCSGCPCSQHSWTELEIRRCFLRVDRKGQ